ncbi:hypothetical protein LguiB_003956 [Lonicera macranthoides]
METSCSLLSSTFVLLFSFLFATSSAKYFSNYPRNDFVQCLILHSTNSTSISQVIYTPNNSSYTSVLDLQLQNLRFATPTTPKPQVIVTPVEESQISSVIYCAKENGLQIRIRCGGHDFEGLSYVAQVPFVMLDMVNLRSIDVDVENATAWVQGGANLGEVYHRIAEKSSTLGFPGGTWSTVGVGGLISGGGYGTMKRKYGLAADNVIDARFMDVKGRILDRESMGEDLFWAIRGGGGSSFGVVLAWKLKLVAVPEVVTVFQVNRTLEENATSLVYKWQTVANQISDDLYMRVRLRSAVINSTSSNRTVRAVFEALYLGGVDSVLDLMHESFPELGLVREDCTATTWIRSTLEFSGFSDTDPIDVMLNRTAPPRFYTKGKSDYVKTPIPIEGLEGIWKLFSELEVDGPNMVMTPYGGKMAEISESAIPFPHRAGNLYMLYEGVYWRPETSTLEQQRRLAWLRNLNKYLTPYVSKNPRESYVNYNDLDLGVGKNYLTARIWGRKYFKDNFNRLVQVKTMVDPDNFFRHEQSIPTLSALSDM